MDRNLSRNNSLSISGEDTETVSAIDHHFTMWLQAKREMAGEEFPIDVDDIEREKLIKQSTEIELIQASTSSSQPKEIIFGTDAQLIQKLPTEKGEEDRIDQQNMVKLQRAPEIMLRNKEFEEYYKPMELSIGPLHAKDPKLFKEELKLELAAKYIRDSGQSADRLREIVRGNIEHLKTFFDKQVIASYSDDSLARLLFLDGCAMLQFINSYVRRQSLNEFKINSGQAALIQQDLFLLENQIPYDVLRILIRSENENVKYNILEFVLMNNIMAPVDSIGPLSDRDMYLVVDYFQYGHACHLLDLLRAIVVIHHHDNPNSPNGSNSFLLCLYYISAPFLFVASKLGSLTACILSFFHFYHRRPGHLQAQLSFHSVQLSFRNVQELKAAGITLKPSDSCSVKAVSFHTRSFFRGQLKLPPLIVDDSTKRKLLNLVAYEMCNPKYQENCEVTSYINLLDLLIDNEQDVKDLRAANILRNRLSSDVDVAKLFNSIGSTCFMPPTDTYLEVKSNIENHYKRKITVWMAQAYHAHFSSPWTILTLLAAVIVLSLTAIQTWFAIHPKN